MAGTQVSDRLQLQRICRCAPAVLHLAPATANAKTYKSLRLTHLFHTPGSYATVHIYY